MTRIVLVHGAATTPAIWGEVVERLGDVEVTAPARPGTGVLVKETDWLEALAPGAVILGVSGGATLVLELAARGGGGAHALIAHEPAAGTLAPGLFPPLAAALAHGGVDAFGAALYGPLWTRDASIDDDAVARDLAMFRTFEPSPPAGDVHVIVTTGGRSPALRHDAAAALHAVHGYATEIVADCGHFLPAEAPDGAAALVRSALAAA